MIDSHCHLDLYPAAEDQLSSWLKQGLTALVTPSTDSASLQRLLVLARRFPGQVFPAAGVHPEQPVTPQLLEQAQQMARWVRQGGSRQLCAIGEVGLPCYSQEPPYHPISRERFALFARLAVDCDLPLIVHAVHAAAALALELLQQLGVRRAVFHWLKAPREVAQEIAAAGYCASLTPEICCMQRDGQLSDCFPLTQLLAETDGPYPQRLTADGGIEDTPTPLWTMRVHRALAARQHLPEQVIARQLDQNARQLFGLPASCADKI